MASLGSPTLDCFRNGSVIQLKAKITDKTLSLNQGGNVSGNGGIGYYGGCLGPRTPIWGRWTDGTYHQGIISKVGIKVHIKFNDGDTISHDAHDQTAVVADVNPDPEVIKDGTRVIAQYRGSVRYYTGRVNGVNRANPRFPSYDIKFDDGDRGWAELNQLRILPKITPSVGSVVWGRWTNKLYYHGRVTGTSSRRIYITFDDGDKISHDQSDISAVLMDVMPKPTHVPVGSRVIAGWKDRPYYFMGRVAQVDSPSSNYYIHYDDGDSGWQTINKIRLLPMRVDDVGARIYGRWKNGLYYPGKVERVDSKIHIKFDDGDKIAHNPNDVEAVILDVNPDPGAVLKGSQVIAYWPRRVQFYSGLVADIDARENRYYILYDDGDKGWARVDQLRLMPVPDAAMAAQFKVTNMGGKKVALNNIAYPQFFLGIDNNGRLKGKTLDNYCHFYVHETPDQYVSLEACMFPGQHIGVNHDGRMTLPACTPKNHHAFFEVKLLFSPYSQVYKANHSGYGPPPFY